MTISEAREIAQRHLDDSGYTERGQRLVIFSSDGMAGDLGWCYMFHFNTARYMETRDYRDAMGPGPGPIAVVKKDGAIHEMGSAPGYKAMLIEWGEAHGYV